ncbi:unnamed protein product [Discosporangium mesarthrocarpum]
MMRLLREQLEPPSKPQRGAFGRAMYSVRNGHLCILLHTLLLYFFSSFCCCFTRMWKEEGDEGSHQGGGNGRVRSADNAVPTSNCFIFVKFNAWQVSGSDILWASLISTLYKEVEGNAPFGKAVVRRKHILEHLESSSLSWWTPVAWVASVALVVTVAVVLLGKPLEQSPFRIASTLFGGIALFPIVTTCLKIIPLVANGPSEGVIQQAASLAKEDLSTINGTNLMSNVRSQIKVLFDTIHAYNKDVDDRNKTKVNDHTNEPKLEKRLALLVTIEDLDRCPKERIVLMLQAVHLLLQQEDAPIVLVMAVDPRIIVTSIEEYLGKIISEEVTGVEYLDKIIHIPFCLPAPPPEARKKLLRALLHHKQQEEWQRQDGTGAAPPSAERQKSDGVEGQDAVLNEVEHCMFHKLFAVISTTPRKMKRVTNVYTIQRLYSLREMGSKTVFLKNFAKKLVTWVILSEFWPCRISCITRSMEEIDLETPTRGELIPWPSNDQEEQDIAEGQERRKTLDESTLSVLYHDKEDGQPRNNLGVPSVKKRMEINVQNPNKLVKGVNPVDVRLRALDLSERAFRRVLELGETITTKDVLHGRVEVYNQKECRIPALIQLSFNLNPAIRGAVYKMLADYETEEQGRKYESLLPEDPDAVDYFFLRG